MKYYLIKYIQNSNGLFVHNLHYFTGFKDELEHFSMNKTWAFKFKTIEAAKSKGQELGGDFQIVNERFEVVWPVK